MRYQGRRAGRDTDNTLLLAAAGLGVFFAARTAVRFSRRFDFGGKTVLITGGSRGLGLLLAREFLDEGANVAICARDSAELERAKAALRGVGRRGRVVTIACDVTDNGQGGQMVREVVAELGSLDVLVNNAGTITVGPMETMTLADYEEAMKTHFWTSLYTTLAALPVMRG